MSSKKALLILFSFFLISLVFVLILILKARRHSSAPGKLEAMPYKEMIIRKPTFAGSFYPADKDELAGLVDSFLEQASVVQADGNLRVLIVPHAGLEYSGATAAWGFKQIKGKNYTRVILLGVSHRTAFDYAAIYDSGSWETPLGKVAIDEDFAARFLNGQEILADSRLHSEEHSLEVELIFLQRVLKDFKIVPILLGHVASKTIDGLAEKISRNLDEETLLVVSSDLSHYPKWADANTIDAKTIEAIVSGSVEKFEGTIKELESENYLGLDTCACGADAIKVALRVAGNLGLKNFEKIRYETSGDPPAGGQVISGDKSRVVGYAAVGVWGEESLEETDFLDEAAKTEALAIARETLEGYLGGGRIPRIAPVSAKLNQPLGAFVTLRNKGELRGCIGEFEPEKPLYQVIEEMAIAAATEDSRFPSVTASELKEINIEISVMTPKKKIDDWKKIELGKHGVVIRKDFRSGTFLPQVATETGWSKEEFLSQLCSQKAGLPPDCYKDPLVNLFVFEAQVFKEN